MLDRTIEVDPIRLVNLVCLHVYAFKRHKVDLHIIFFSEGHQLHMWSSFDDVFPIQPLWFPLRSSASDPPNVNTLCLTASRLLFLGPPFLFLAFANVTSIRSSSNSPLVFGGRVYHHFFHAFQDRRRSLFHIFFLVLKSRPGCH